MPNREVKDTRLKRLDTITVGTIGDDAILVRTLSFGWNRCRRKPSSPKREPFTGKKRATVSKPEGHDNVFTHSPMTPNYVFDDNNLSRQMQKHTSTTRSLHIFSNLIRKTNSCGPQDLEPREGVKKRSPQPSHGTRWIFLLDSNLLPRNFDTRRKQHFVGRVLCLHLKHLGETTQSFQRDYIKACQELQWAHGPNTPHPSENDGIAERAVRRVGKKERQRRCFKVAYP